MKSLVEIFRAEERHLIETATSSSETRLRKELSAHALRLFERAETIANSMEEPEIIEMNIGRYQHMPAGGLTDELHRKASMRFAAAQTLLGNRRRKTPTPNVAWRDR